jgi:hypothetical protein
MDNLTHTLDAWIHSDGRMPVAAVFRTDSGQWLGLDGQWIAVPDTDDPPGWAPTRTVRSGSGGIRNLAIHIWDWAIVADVPIPVVIRRFYARDPTRKQTALTIGESVNATIWPDPAPSDPESPIPTIDLEPILTKLDALAEAVNGLVDMHDASSDPEPPPSPPVDLSPLLVELKTIAGGVTTLIKRDAFDPNDLNPMSLELAAIRQGVAKLLDMQAPSEPDVPESVTIEAGGPGWTAEGLWAASAAFPGTFYGDGAKAFGAWTFPVEIGAAYRVSVTWPVHANRGKASYKVDGAAGAIVDQAQPPMGLPDGDGRSWQVIGEAVATGPTLAVRISGTGTVGAWLCRLERIALPVGPPAANSALPGQ